MIASWDDVRADADDEAQSTCGDVVAARVGGRFWASPATVGSPPAGGFTIVSAPHDAAGATSLWRKVLDGVEASHLLLVLPGLTGAFMALAMAAVRAGCSIVGPVDPHSVLDLGRDVHVAEMDDLAVLGLLAGFDVWRHDEDGIRREDRAVAQRWLVQGTRYIDPFTGAPASCLDTTLLLAEWRRLIAANRDVAVCSGMSLWKRPRIGQFFATGEARPAFRRGADAAVRAARAAGGGIAVWSTRVPRTLETKAHESGIPLHRVEDGFIRSLGLGSDLLPPASIIVDRSGIYFDPSRPSDLETLFASFAFDNALRARARRLIDLLVRSGVSKYATAGAAPDVVFAAARPGQRIVLVPGQVADDLSVRLGCGEVRGNADLLARVRAANTEAFIVYRPHPDVEAGHRPGAIADPVAAGLADQVSRGGAIAPLIAAVDEVHTLTSLCGFEALLRGRRVETYGQPFYAGWGLTTDHAPLARRQRCLTVEELAAAALILYPRYVDPVTGLPCGPEVLIARLGDATLWRPSLLMRLRRLQGRIRRGLRDARTMAVADRIAGP